MAQLSCEQFREKIHPLLDGELNAQDQAQLEEHMAQCPDCRSEFEDLKALREELSHLDDDLKVPLEFERGWRNAVRREASLKRTRRWVRALSGVAAAFVALMGVTAFNRATGRLPSEYASATEQPAYAVTADLLDAASNDPSATQSMSAEVEGAGTVDAQSRSLDDATTSVVSGYDASDEVDGTQARYDYSSEDSLSATTSGSAGLLDVDESNDTSTGSSIKVLRSASLTLETENFDADMDAIKDTVAKYGGLFERNAVSGDVGNRRAELTLRVPAALLENYVEQLRSLCHVLESEISAQDITSQYSDTALRLDTYRVQLNRVKELTAQAADLNEVLELEEEASRLQYEIDKLTGMLNGWDSQTEMSTVNIVLTEYSHVDASIGSTGFSGRVGEQFAQSMNTIRSFMGDMMLSAIALLPHLAWVVPVAAVAALGIHFAKRSGTHRRRHAD